MKFKALAFLILGLFTYSSCVDHMFDEPPQFEFEQVEPNKTVADVTGLLVKGQVTAIPNDFIIDGYVAANDESGNFYKQIVIQDETGGIQIRLDAIGVYNDYPEGRRVFVKCDGLYISDYNGLPQLSMADVSSGQATSIAIPENLIADYIVNSTESQTIEPNQVEIDDLNESMLNTLIKFEDVQFTVGSAAKPLADIVNQFSVNHYIENCSGDQIIVRTSGFASFAGEFTPVKKGNITGVLSVFGNDYQLLIRDYDDIQMESERCGVEVVEPNAKMNEVLDLLKLGSLTKINEDIIIEAHVVANDRTGNFYKNLILEDETGGIAIRLDALNLYNSFPEGRKVYIKCNGLYIGDYNGLPQLSLEDSGSSVAIPEGNINKYLANSQEDVSIEPNLISISSASEANLNRFISLENVEFTDGSKEMSMADGDNNFSVNHFIQDCDGNEIIVRTSGYASFADKKSPGGNGNIQGILSVFNNDYQIILRDYNDMTMNGQRCDGSNNNGENGNAVRTVDEDFESLSDNQDVNLEGWKNIAVKGSRLWRAKEFDNNVYVQATAYNDNANEMEAWLITPKINFEEAMQMTMRSAVAFYVHDGLSVYYSNDFDGENVDSATWKELNIEKRAGSGEPNYAWVDSETIDLSEIQGEAVIGFRYTGNPVNGTTSVILDDIQITAQ